MNHQSNKSQKRTTRNKKQQQRSIQERSNSRARNDSTLTIPRSVGAVVPDRLKTTLRFWKALAIDQSLSPNQMVRFQPSAAYDVDPTVASTAMAGFNELSALFRSYRVKSSRIKVETACTSLDSMVQVTVLPTNSDPGSSLPAGYAVSAREQPYAISKTAAPLGGGMCNIFNSMTTKKIFGSPMTDYDDNFAALVNTIPVNNWFWVIIFYSLATIPSADPTLCNVYIEVDVEFYDRAFLYA